MNQPSVMSLDEPSRRSVAVETLRPELTRSIPRSLTRGEDFSVEQEDHGLLITRILLPTDFSAASAKAVKYGVTLANQCSAALTILHVVDVSSQLAFGTAEDLMRNLWTESSAKMAQLAWSLSGQAEVQTMLAEGLPWEVIIEKSNNFDLVLLGKKHGKTHRKFFSPHTTKRVIEKATCPVTIMQF